MSHGFHQQLDAEKCGDLIGRIDHRVQLDDVHAADIEVGGDGGQRIAEVLVVEAVRFRCRHAWRDRRVQHIEVHADVNRQIGIQFCQNAFRAVAQILLGGQHPVAVVDRVTIVVFIGPKAPHSHLDDVFAFGQSVRHPDRIAVTLGHAVHERLVIEVSVEVQELQIHPVGPQHGIGGGVVAADHHGRRPTIKDRRYQPGGVRPRGVDVGVDDIDVAAIDDPAIGHLALQVATIGVDVPESWAPTGVARVEPQRHLAGSSRTQT